MKVKRISPTVNAILVNQEDAETLSNSFSLIATQFPTLYHTKGILPLCEAIEYVKASYKGKSKE